MSAATVYQGFLGNASADINPSTGGGIAFNMPAGPDVYSAAVQLHAGLAEDRILYQFLIAGSSLNPQFGAIIQFGTGAAGSEVWLPVEVPYTMGQASSFTNLTAMQLDLPMGILLPAGVRIAFRARSSLATIKSGSRIVATGLIPAAALASDDIPYGKDTLGSAYSFDALGSTAVPIAVTTGASADAYGAAVQLHAAVPNDLWLCTVSAAWPGTSAGGDVIDVQLGAGAAGAEVWHAVARFKCMGQAAGFHTGVNQFRRLDSAIFVPAGTRVAARSKGNNAAQAAAVLVGVAF